MNKKSIKIIICLFIILGIFAISKNIYAETLIADRVITVEDIPRENKSNAVILTNDEIKQDIINKDSYCENFTSIGELKDIYISDDNIVKASIIEEGLKISGKKAGEIELEITVPFYKTVYIFGFSKEQYVDSRTIKYKVIVKDKEAEKKEVEDKHNEAIQSDENMKNAWKTIPNKDASATEIDRFIKSDAKFNNGKKINSITDKELLKAWESTIKSSMVDTISRDMYKYTLTAIQDRIYDRKVSDSTLKNLANQMSGAITATETTIDNYEKQILEISKSLGNPRVTNVIFTDVLTDIESYIPNDSDSGNDKVEEKASVILTIITNIGIILSVLMSAIIGVKYMLASIEEKAEYKQEMIPYLIGSALLFGISTIVKILQDIGTNINNT